MIGIYKDKLTNKYAAIIYREGKKNNLKGYLYDLEVSFEGSYSSQISLQYNILIEDYNDEDVKLILNDLKNKFSSNETSTKATNTRDLIYKYETKIKDNLLKKEEETLKIVINNNFIYFGKEILDISSIDYICEDFFILKGFPQIIEKKIPLKVIEAIKDIKNKIL